MHIQTIGYALLCVFLLVFIIILILQTSTSSVFETLEVSDTLPIPDTGIITPGYYNVPNSRVMARIPYGYRLNIVDASGNGTLVPLSETAIYSAKQTTDACGNNPLTTLNSTSTRSMTYNSNNYDIQYHDTPSEAQQNDLGLPNQGTWVLDKSGKVVYIPWADMSQNVTYYTSGAYPYGASSYVPSYEESVYLSKTTGQGTTGKYYDTASQMGGFCVQDAASPEKLEQSCNALSLNQCATTSCCVLLGGSKCVNGSIHGPKLNANYSDPFLANKDFYYYQGKCYGDCQHPAISSSLVPTTAAPVTTTTPGPTTTPAPTTLVPTTTPAPTTLVPTTTPAPTTLVPTTTPAPTTPGPTILHS